jgi:hypothetical protein
VSDLIDPTPQRCDLPWCPQSHTKRPAGRHHVRDAGTIGDRGTVLVNVVMQQLGGEPPYVRIFLDDDVTGHFVDVTPDVAAVIGRLMTTLSPPDVREAGEAFTSAAATLLGGTR